LGLLIVAVISLRCIRNGYWKACPEAELATRLIEEGPVPRDAERIGITWKYVNKGGGPDRRYKNNPQLPSCGTAS
jgi:hypothetical protein